MEQRDDSLVNQDVTADHTPSIISDQGEESVMVFEEFGTKLEVCLFREIFFGLISKH